MGNAESAPGQNPFPAPVETLSDKLQALEQALHSIQEAHQEAQGHHLPAAGSQDIFLQGARLMCDEGVTITVGPVIGEVGSNFAVVLLEVNVSTGASSKASVTAYVSLTDANCPRGRVVYSCTQVVPSDRPVAFKLGPTPQLLPAREYKVCFGGVCSADARQHVGCFRTLPATSDHKEGLRILAVSGDQPQTLLLGQPSLWNTLAERVSGVKPRVDVLLHLGGQVWLAEVFQAVMNSLYERLRDMQLSARGGWDDALVQAEMRIREAHRRAFCLEGKRAVMARVCNIMVAGECDMHHELSTRLCQVFNEGGTQMGEG
ncbi:unnamed protein product, partial [Chrysoparadoxa australica]